MSRNQQAVTIRSKKLGVLIMDARLACRHSIDECAEVLHVSPEQFQAYEKGQQAPSLPEIELLAFYLNIPIDHFWGSHSMSEEPPRHTELDIEKLMQLRQRMIGLTMRKGRTDHNLSLKDLSERTGISEEDLNAYELGQKAVTLPELEMVISSMNGNLDEFFDQSGPVGNWHVQQEAIQDFLGLPETLRDFVSKPVNHPYIELAIRLSEMSVDKLRAVAEGLLEITY